MEDTKMKKSGFCLMVLLLSILMIGTFLFPVWNKTAVSAEQKDKFTIGVVYAGLQWDYVVALQKACQETAAALGVELIELDDVGDIEKESANMELLIAKKVDAVAIAAVDFQASVPLINNVVDHKIPVVEFNVNTAGSKRSLFIGSEHEQSGAMLARWMLAKLKESGKDKLTVIYLRGVPGHVTNILRDRGLRMELGDAINKFEIIEKNADYQREQALRVTEDILQRTQNIDLIAALNDDMILGAYQAVKAAGLEQKIKMCGVDGIPEVLQLIKEGKMDATIFQNPEAQASGGILYAYAILKGIPVPKVILIPFEEVNAGNADYYLAIADRVYAPLK
jgi:inositol transport system substrate-binding protein